MFITTSMPVGGAENLVVNLVRGLDREQFAPELCCLKERGPLGELLAAEIPVHSDLIRHKYDFRILGKLTRLFRERQIDALVTVGAGDKMFWGRLAAWRAGVPVVISALHSTGWPDGVGRLNRMLTPLTDAFIGVAKSHGRYLTEEENFPADKVFVIPNGVDTDQYVPNEAGDAVRRQLGISPTAPIVATVAALRPEKNHEMLLDAARLVINRMPEAHFLIVGDGPQRMSLEQRAIDLGIVHNVHFLGCRHDVPRILSAAHVFALTSHNEANPLSILEAMSAGVPVVATNVGSVCESVLPGQTGWLVPPGDVIEFANRTLHLLSSQPDRYRMSHAARQLVVDHASLNATVHGYERLIATLFDSKLSQ
jgi:glycosyltransferase involved in cell wall biosynthesis